ncbi:metallophosphoesterase family protein [Telmatocola sphagniphila]|uniref:Metallophosphoesterase family protein n=1 Tax=Telmatocola sphagniphila TaxID=1123043 RepID=A0A8E6B288_9BACT|nr:metallophosphoesterase family protein [Telmatocola sphagniphila]QVL30492.1 metallophosphoesterase family protein [Telmatocola sphagniphila]
MFPASRRQFLGTSLTGLTASTFLGSDAFHRARADDPTFTPNTLFLTWQRDPTTTMTIQWVGVRGETADTNIYYHALNSTNLGPVQYFAQSPVLKPYPMTDYKIFRAELTGLKPGTDYQFFIGKQSPSYRFRTMPAKANDTISFISGGDCGVNEHTIANNIQAARQDPMFAIVGGDLGYDNGRSVDISLAFLRNYSKHMIGRDGRLIPLIAGIGNHEVANGGYGQKREQAPFFYALFDGLYPETGYASLDFGDYLSLILLDTGHTSAIGGEQADWLESTLRARQDSPNVFAINHVPSYPSFRKMEGEPAKIGKPPLAGTGEENRKYWVPLFERFRVPVVLEHHDHTFKRTKPLINGLYDANGVLYLGDGSWGRLRNPNSPDKLHHLAVASRDYHLSLHRIQGDERFHLALDENGRVMDVSRTGQRKQGLVRASG